MKKKMIPLHLSFSILLISLLMCFFVPLYALKVNAVAAEEYEEYVEEEYNYKEDGYYISSYHIDMTVNEDNSYQITEKISAYFNEERHGIRREIPLRNDVVRLDGTTAVTRARISDIKVNEKYSESKEDGYRVIQIGDANKTVIGAKDYTISYLYHLGKDKAKDYDELYFNLIGDKWDAASEKVTFTITMPKDFDHEKVGFSSGTYGSVENSNVTYTIEGNVMKGSLTEVLPSYEALTVRAELVEGYFVRGSFKFPLEQLPLFIIPLFCVLAAFLLWLKYGKDLMVITSVEFRPPGNFNSVEIAYLYKGSTDTSDVISLLVYLANKGYLKIVESGEKTMFMRSRPYNIVKLKDYDGKNISEKLFIEGLFESGKTSVTAKDLYNRFYTTIAKIRRNIERREIRDKIFESSNRKRALYFVLLILMAWMGGVGIPTLEYGNMSDLMSSAFMCLFFIPILIITILKSRGLIPKIFVVALTIPIMFVLFRDMPIGIAIQTDIIYVFGVITCAAGIVVILIFLRLLPKRTPAGTDLLGKIQGFKEFLETADKDRLEALVMDNPAYFYDILPYTYVLNVSRLWIKKFDAIALQSPDWYSGHNSFDAKSFQRFMDSSMASACQAPQSKSSSGSSSSGGGSAGGGSGGGGGSSW